MQARQQYSMTDSFDASEMAMSRQAIVCNFGEKPMICKTRKSKST
jgi:hypothetical protein